MSLLTEEVSPAGTIRFLPDSADTTCNRAGAKALRHYADRFRPTIGVRLG